MSTLQEWFQQRSRPTRWLLGLFIIGAVGGLGAFAWYVTTPKALDFAGGNTVPVAQYHDGDPTGVPAALKSASVVKRGEYLTRAADCTVCHTVPGGKPYAGGLAFKLPFGTIYSSNITSDRKTASAGIQMPNSSLRCDAGSGGTVRTYIRRCHLRPTHT
jgi:hypothetical protein